MTEGQELTFKYEVAEGTFYVTIQAAEIQRKGTWQHPKEEFIPRIQVHTDASPLWSDDEEARGWVKIRGRKYRADQWFRFVTWAESKTTAWTGDGSNGYRGGYRNDRMVQIDYTSKTYKRLDEIVAEVRNLFVAENPSWVRESERLGLLAKRKRFAYDADLARKALDEAEKGIAEVDAVLATY